MRRRLAVLWLGLCLGSGVVAGCLASFAPPVRTRGPHADLEPAAADGTCMGCHPAESALEPGVRAPAPIVADWMIDRAEGCTGCHGVRVVRDRGRRVHQHGHGHDHGEHGHEHGHEHGPGAHDHSDHEHSDHEREGYGHEHGHEDHAHEEDRR